MSTAIERAHEAWKRRWAEEKPEQPPERHRYAVVFECDEETMAAVILSLRGFPLGNRTWRYVPPGWVPGDPV